MRDAAKTLLLPFERGVLDRPRPDQPFLFFNAEPLPGWAPSVRAFQDNRGRFLDLQAAGFSVEPAFDAGEGHHSALVLSSRFRALNEHHIARAIAGTQTGSLVVVAGEKTAGIASLRKRVAGLVEIEDALAKHHATVFWFRVPAQKDAVIASLMPTEPPLAEDRYQTGVGQFSAGEIDPGSRLLAEALPGDLAGTVGDFGAGWGYLSVEAASRCPDIASIDLYETSHAALAAARGNMERLAPDCRAGFHWRDLTHEPVERRFDAIVMNPPFHDGRRAEPAIGSTFIKAAAAALKPGGRLLMIANRHLPYERALSTAFRRMAWTREADGFKLFEAIR